MYVDNLVTRADSTADALQMYADSKRMFDSASMNLREWLSSSAEFNKCIPENDRRKSADTTVLGHGWNNETDVLYVHTLSISDSQKGITKRSVLKVIASVYDPQGLFSAVLVKGKLLLQEIWTKKYGWDDVIGDDDIRKRWFVIKDDIAHLSKSAVQRCIAQTHQFKKHVAREKVLYAQRSSIINQTTSYYEDISSDEDILKY